MSHSEFTLELQAAQTALREGPQAALDRMDAIAGVCNVRDTWAPLLASVRYAGLRRNREVLQELRAELLVGPHDAAQRDLSSLLDSVPRGSSRYSERSLQSGITADQFQSIEFAAQRYVYRGVPLVKNCFDLALYPLLLEEVRPATIIEIGSLYGGSALWLADLSRTLGFETQILSIDVRQMHLVQDPRVRFIVGSGRELARVLTPQVLEELPRPMLVIEDADHEAVTTLAVLNFFDPILRGGEYIVVEDTLSAPGARQGLAEFMAANEHKYDVDARWCDFFGPNLTWCVNGFLRKK